VTTAAETVETVAATTAAAAETDATKEAAETDATKEAATTAVAAETDATKAAILAEEETPLLVPLRSRLRALTSPTTTTICHFDPLGSKA
jgi:hypothetical protein